MSFGFNIACARSAETRASCCPAYTDSSTDSVVNPSSSWLRLIALIGFGLVKPSTFTEAHENEQSGRTLRRIYDGCDPESHPSLYTVELNVSVSVKVVQVGFLAEI
jgi:hypothetical protein